MDIQRWLRRAYNAYCKKKNWQRIVRMLAVVVVFCTTYVLMLPAITLESKTVCGYTEHLHSDQCYELQEPPACTLPEIQEHSHSEDCWQENSALICGLEELEEHLHEPSCYETSRELICDLEETPGHSHEEDSQEPVKVLICPLEEHNHTDACYPVEETEPTQQIHSEMDSTADLETEEDWEAGLATVEMTGNWISDLLAVAKSQLGYSESQRNYIYDENNVIRPYTRYGQWIGQPYGEWSASFVSFCLHYAQAEGLEAEQSCEVLATAAKEAELWLDLEDYEPAGGDLIFLDRNGDGICDHVAIVEEQLSDETAKAAAAVIPMREPAAIPEETTDETAPEETTGQTAAVTEPVTEAVTEPAPEVVYTGDNILRVISGDVMGKVDRIHISLADTAVMGFARLPEDPEIPPGPPHIYEQEDGSLTQVQFAGDTSVPQDAELTVREITAAEEGYAEMTRQVQELLDTEEASITLLDISFYDSEGEYLSVTDTAQVLMDLELEDPQQTRVRVFHFVDGVPVELENTDLIQTAASTMALLEEGETQPLIQTQLMFETDGFSVFAVVKVMTEFEQFDLNDVSQLDGNSFYIVSNSKAYGMKAEANQDGMGLVKTPISDLATSSLWTFAEQDDNTYLIHSGDLYLSMPSADPNGVGWAKLEVVARENATAFTVGVYENDSGIGQVTISRTIGTQAYYINLYQGNNGPGFYGWKDAPQKDAGSRNYLYRSADAPDTSLTVLDLAGKSFAIVGNGTSRALSDDVVTVNGVPGMASQQVTTFIHDGQTRYSGDVPEWTFEATTTEGAYRVSTTDAEGNKKYLTFLRNGYTDGNTVSTSKGSLTLEDLNETNNQIIHVVANEDGTVYLTVQNGNTISYINRDQAGGNFWVYDYVADSNKLLLCEKTGESLLNYNLNSPATSGWFTNNDPYLSQTKQVVTAEGVELYSVANKNSVGSFVYNSLPQKTDVLAYYSNYNEGLDTNLNADTHKAPGSEWRFLGWQATVNGTNYLFREGADAIPQADGVHIVDVDGVERILPDGTTLTGQWKKISDVVMFFVNYYDTMLDKQQKKIVSDYNSSYYTKVVAIGRLFNAIEIEPDGKTNEFNGWINIKNHEVIQGELRQQYNPNEIVDNEETTQLVIDAVAVLNEAGTAFEFKTVSNLNQGMLEEWVTLYLQNNPDANTGIKLDKAHVDKSEITADNYQLYWYLQKGVGGDGWHIDGVLVAKTQPMEIYKTFSGLTREEAESAIERMTFPLHLIHTTGNQDVKDPYIDLEASKDLDGVYKRYGWQSTSNIYKWTLNSVQGQRYTFEEEDYQVADHDVSSLISVHYKDGTIEYKFSDATYTGTEGSNNITDLYAEKPLIGGEVESIIFANFYTATDTGAFSVSKVADEAGRVRLPGATFTLTDPNNNYSVTKVTNENGAVSFEDLLPGTYTLRETDAPAGYQEQPDMYWTVTVTQETTTDGKTYSVVTILPKDGTEEEEVTLYDGSAGGMQKVYLIQNDPVKTTVTVNKRFTNISDANLETLKADYEIAVTDAAGNPIKDEEDNHIVLKLNNATESMGVYTWTINLPDVGKTYKFVERNFYHQAYIDAAVTATVVNWEMVGDEWTAVERPAEVTKTFTDGIPVTASISMVKSDRADTVSFTNNYIDTFQLQILKVDASSENSDPIQGVIFNIYGEYKDAQGSETFTYTDENGNVHILQQQNKDPLVTDEDGKVSFDNMKLSSTAQNKEFLYVIKETWAPDTYLQLDEPIVKTVRINDGDPNYANGVYILTVENWTPDLAPVTIIANKVWNIPEDMEKSPITLHLYQGVKNSDTVTKLQTITVAADGNAVTVVESALEEHQSVTAKDWTITWTGLPYHNSDTAEVYEYYISEEPIPIHSTSYSTSVSNKTFTVTEGTGEVTKQQYMAQATGYKQKRSTTITNTSGYALPSTGGSGNRWYAPLGLLLILAAAAGYWLSDKKKKQGGVIT